MTDQSKDNPLENKPRDNGNSIPPELTFQNEDENHSDFDRTINLNSPLISEPDTRISDSTTQFDSMESLFEEEPDTATDGADAPASPEVETDRPSENTYDLDINTGELDGLQDFMMDENDDQSAPVKKIKLTETDYADTNTRLTDTLNTEEAQESTEPGTESTEENPETPDETSGMSGRMAASASKSEEAVDSTMMATAASRAHDLRDEPKISTESKTETRLPEGPAAPSRPAPRASLAAALGLLGMIGASGALWMDSDLSKRMDQLESRLAGMQRHAVTPAPDKSIASLNKRLDELNARITARFKTIVRTKATNPLAEAKKPSAPLPEAIKPAVAAITPAVDSGRGPWVVNLTSLSHATAANNEVARLKGLGIRAEVIKIETQGKTWYRIRVPGFASAEKAERQRKILTGQLNIQDTWISKR